MGKYTRNCSCTGCSSGIMEVAVDNSKRRKVSNGELKLSSSKLMRITSLKNLSNHCDDDVTSFISGDRVPTCCCSSNGSFTEKVKFSDLKNENEIETSVRQNSETTESTQSTDLKDESSELKSEKAPVVIDARRTIPPEKMPPAAELEEFFAAAEKDLHKSFKDKYNYDVVNDVPLKGRYEWVELKE
ncbi:cyclin-dependent kinase inhibitor 7-like [Rutidosis leptorrhynchoides]|uniref:cyclin-dependent kinase inhibitor 7-like n=1 Tax=Rutidosis leptorrhynchoides TaxID=125765 RepID=UPI003A9977EB